MAAASGQNFGLMGAPLYVPHSLTWIMVRSGFPLIEGA